MKTIIIAAVLGLIGCGGSDGVSTTRDPLSGTEWESPINGFACARILRFDDVGNFGSGIGCTLNSGQIAEQVALGTYEATGDAVRGGVLTLHMTKSSCPGTMRGTVSAEYTPGTDLTVGFPTGVIDFVPLATTGGSGGSVAYGCFDDAFNFTASPLVSL